MKKEKGDNPRSSAMEPAYDPAEDRHEPTDEVRGMDYDQPTTKAVDGKMERPTGKPSTFVKLGD